MEAKCTKKASQQSSMICSALSWGDVRDAASVARRDYEFVPEPRNKRQSKIAVRGSRFVRCYDRDGTGSRDMILSYKNHGPVVNRHLPDGDPIPNLLL